jgi:hypothetical protein
MDKKNLEELIEFLHFVVDTQIGDCPWVVNSHANLNKIYGRTQMIKISAQKFGK